MEDFYKNIKDNLENRDEPSFDKRAWKDMKKRLDKKPWAGFGNAGWILPLALGLVFLSNIFFFKKLNEANEKITKLEQRADTIYQAKYIYQYDTIYRQSVEKQYVVMTQPDIDFYPSPLFYNHQDSYSQSSNSLNSNQYSLTFAELKFLFEDEKGTLAGEENIDSKEVSTYYGSPFLSSNYALLENETGYAQLSYLDHPAHQKKKKRPFQKLAADIQPIDFQFGVIGGFAFPQDVQVAETGGFGVGIHGAMTFYKNMRLWAEASYYKVEFKSNVMGEALGIPEIQQPDDEYYFVDASVHQPFYQYVFGLQYIFNVKKKWNPYFGVGYTFNSMRPYEVSYDFENDVDGLELSIEEKHNRNDLIMNMALFNAGVEAKLSKHFGFQLEGYYRWDGNKDGILVTDILGIRSKLVYNF